MKCKHATIAALASLALAPSFLALAQSNGQPEPVPAPAPLLSCFSANPQPHPLLRVSVFPRSPGGPTNPTPEGGPDHGLRVKVLEEDFSKVNPNDSAADRGNAIVSTWQNAILTGSGTSFRLDYFDGITSLWGDWTIILPGDDPATPPAGRYGNAVLNRLPQSSVVELLCVAP